MHACVCVCVFVCILSRFSLLLPFSRLRLDTEVTKVKVSLSLFVSLLAYLLLNTSIHDYDVVKEYMYACVYICMYICMYTCMQVHTHQHVPLQPLLLILQPQATYQARAKTRISRVE